LLDATGLVGFGGWGLRSPSFIYPAVITFLVRNLRYNTFDYNHQNLQK